MKKIKVGFKLSKEIVDKLNRFYLEKQLEGEKITKSEIVERALREYLKKEKK
ncbi:hypothetical protein [Persephonella sp. KM09-Lau-8]|uniref:hypothetical protein n=1 Tax=Persephonella sp. KM09-Lau-8 TaxID=1158345 RepID=UPI0012DEDB50|nr:hypothetical protein [Persephonella sp. KM09-Lau-8]